MYDAISIGRNEVLGATYYSATKNATQAKQTKARKLAHDKKRIKCQLYILQQYNAYQGNKGNTPSQHQRKTVDTNKCRKPGTNIGNRTE